ncbi:Uncharacterised protein [Bordetella pertussis]|nr:Uncharacterised protein [Bordetella pertussis]
MVFCATAPSFSYDCRTSGLSSALTMAAFSVFTTSGGVPAGAIRPNHDDTSKFSKPDSFMVGRSGALAERSVVVTASARSLPACTCGHDDGMLSNMNCTWPPIRSVTAGALPLYGTCSTSIPARCLNSSPAMWIEVPLPDEAKASLPGLALV